MFAKDEQALNGAVLMHMFLDDCGNVVRQWWTDDEVEDFDVDGTWNEGVWEEDFCTGRG